jgi:hypothetical protein
LEAWLLDLQAHDAAGLEGYDPTKDPLAPFLVHVRGCADHPWNATRTKAG